MKLSLFLCIVFSIATISCAARNDSLRVFANGTTAPTNRNEIVSEETEAVAVGETQPAPVSGDPSARARVYFEFDSAELSATGRAELDKTVQWLKENPNREATIFGYTDEIGTTNYNYDLGLRRALAVEEYLKQQGVDSGRIRVVSFGEKGPDYQDNSRERRALFMVDQQG
jgi:outer membrane protein OmpA-like peptidoglycan-associated protein